MKSKKIRLILLLISDAFGIFASLFIAFLLRIGEPIKFLLNFNLFIPSICIGLIVITSYYIFGLYDKTFISFDLKNLILYSLSLVFISFAGIIIFYLRPFVLGRGIFVYFLICLSIFTITFRLLLFKFTHQILPCQNILYLGSQKERKELYKIISRYKEYEFVNVSENEGLHINPDALNKSLFDPFILEKADIIIIGNCHIDGQLAKKLIEKRLNGIKLYSFSSFYEMLAQKLPVNLVDDKWFLTCPGFEKVGDGFYSKMKRIIDVAASITLLIISAPLIFIIPIIIKIDSRGPIFYVQERCGLGENRFKLIKFRTMVNNAEENGPQWASENDPRVTRVGKILRKLRLDELPQLINVLKGDMSLIGPRPERDYFIKELKAKIPYYSLRFYVKPGITGWAQINYRYGASIEDAIEKLAYDLYYIKNMSLLLDISIILKTIRVVLLGHGAR